MKIEVKIERATMNVQNLKNIFHSKTKFNSIIDFHFWDAWIFWKYFLQVWIWNIPHISFHSRHIQNRNQFWMCIKLEVILNALKIDFFFLKWKKPKQMISTKSLQRPFFHSKTSLVAGKGAFLWEITASNVYLTSTQWPLSQTSVC